MIPADTLVASIAVLRMQDIERWVGAGLLRPSLEAETMMFSDSDCARVRLLCTLRYDLEVDEDTAPLVLSLLDQLYDARRQLLSMTAAVMTQDRAVQQSIVTAMQAQAVNAAGGGEAR